MRRVQTHPQLAKEDWGDTGTRRQQNQKRILNLGRCKPVCKLEHKKLIRVKIS